MKTKKKKRKSKSYDEFDLLCLVDGQKIRLPFSKRNFGTPLAIFPFKHSVEYIELDEVENKKHTDKDVDEDHLLDEAFCRNVFKIKKQLNAYLEALKKPILDGEYLADSEYMPGCGWIVSFDNKYDTLASDYFGGNTPAKLRYMGYLGKKD